MRSLSEANIGCPLLVIGLIVLIVVRMFLIVLCTRRMRLPERVCRDTVDQETSG